MEKSKTIDFYSDFEPKISHSSENCILRVQTNILGKVKEVKIMKERFSFRDKLWRKTIIWTSIKWKNDFENQSIVLVIEKLGSVSFQLYVIFCIPYRLEYLNQLLVKIHFLRNEKFSEITQQYNIERIEKGFQNSCLY